jgi:hypothetical protein
LCLCSLDIASKSSCLDPDRNYGDAGVPGVKTLPAEAAVKWFDAAYDLLEGVSLFAFGRSPAGEVVERRTALSSGQSAFRRGSITLLQRCTKAVLQVATFLRIQAISRTGKLATRLLRHELAQCPHRRDMSNPCQVKYVD